EALLRVPDGGTADQLIEDKLDDADWAHRTIRSQSLLASASSWGLAVAARIAEPASTPQGVLAGVMHRIGVPTVRVATRQAIRILGNHFVLGETIGEALSAAASRDGRLYRYSFDMLGEGARTAADAERYFKAYANAIDAIGESAGDRPLPDRPGISIKLSALHPRFEAVSRARVLAELVPSLLKLAQAARTRDLNLTIDAEEADRLELTIEVMEAVLAAPALAGWQGFGLAVQAYQKRAFAVIDHLAGLAKQHDRRLMIRLVKGAYWDTEIKRAQERGLPDYPVFSRKPMTDLNYMACVQKLLDLRPHLYPQFATHNALTVGTIIERAGGTDGYEFQRLHGMGEELYSHLKETRPGTAVRIYAPVGPHKDLLAYLVRRLLENGANSSFVSRVADPSVPEADLLVRPRDALVSPDRARHERIPLPADIFPGRKNSQGLEFGDSLALQSLHNDMQPWYARRLDAVPIASGNSASGNSGADKSASGHARPCHSPIDGAVIGTVVDASAADIAAAFAIAAQAFTDWSAMPAASRAAILEKTADLYQANQPELLALLQNEGGKTLDDAIAEVREAIDFCRYYAQQARTALNPAALPGPTGEENILTYRGRGTFVCISPWNFPLAIFTGQIAAALVTGNCVLAKPAEQTPLIACRAIRLMHEAGIPEEVLHLLPGDGRTGAALVEDRRTAGVAFTGSTEVAWIINRSLAAKNSPIVPLIAETGGINAMIVDATALPEQITDDVLVSAFRSAGQRCSALRLLCVQADIADHVIAMIAGAARELRIGDPREIATHIGPVIDEEARANLQDWCDAADGRFRVHYKGNAPAEGTFFPPHIIELTSAGELTREIFGPVLHIVRWKAGASGDPDHGGLAKLLDELSGSGYGLTLGVHSRISETVAFVTARMSAGNIYVNRSMIGAVVGSQPFGGNGLSGTGPKAGGPNYLHRFSIEQVVSTNTAAAGGNTSLMTMEERAMKERAIDG
ncbi:MAG: bifunctional proline dehydrogenase/L-glutamate gamma-semialdehyde dehydrogenase PutA, partial [Hyphomicrobiales bacterium]|nr:bifunctional proline dehydrogenase/L-glutamate gamma-semialdehyde dehydrogenase PutA [Hyphomicrobiales bacterium]